MARALLLSSLYMHFFVEHNRGHHKNVATPRDPASARMGESLYAFWFRCIRDSFRSAFSLETERLKKVGSPAFSWRNSVLQYVMLELALMLGIYIFFGSFVLLAFLASALLGILLLETINYIEHYGLMRKELSPNVYEQFNPSHAWNSNHKIGRLMLFELTRHSDHHHRASRKYQVLRHHRGSPELPTGYPGSMLISLIPPLWHKLIQKRIGRTKQA